MTTEDFIDALQRRALLPAEAIASLRQFVRKSLKIVTPESLAKMLVEKERITAQEAEQLLNHTAAPVPARADDLSLAPIDDPRRKHLDSERNRAAAAGASASKSPPGKATTAAGPKPAGASTTAAATRTPSTENEKPPDRGLLDDLLAEEQSPAGTHGSSVGLVGKRRPAAPKRVWIAAGGAIVLLFATAVALILTFRGNGDNEWLLAEKDFSSGSDLAAINRLDAFLDAFPKHPRTGAALVYRATARLRQAVAAKTNWEQPLAVASDILPEIVEQPDFTKVRGAFGTILPKMAAGLARQAKDGAKRPLDQRRRQAQAALEGLALAKDPRYTSDSQKPWAILRTTEDDVAGLARAVDRDTELERAATEIRSSIAAGHITAAFAARGQLCERYPELRSDATVESLNQELAEGEVKFIKFDREPHKAPTQPRATPVISTVVFAARNDKLAAGSPTASQGAAGDDAAAIVVFTQGAAYWLSTADGTLLGRQFLGFDSSLPLKIETSKGADFIVFDAVHQELARVSAHAAAPRWRQPLGGPLAGRPSISGDNVFAVTRSGRLLVLDAESGAVLRSVEFAEPFRSQPAISADGTKIAVVSDRGNLFILAAEDLHSIAAASLVDDASAMTIAPVVFGNRLAVVQREGWENSVLRILAVGGGASEIRSLQQIQLAGHLISPPIVESGRLIVATDRGALAVLEADGAANGPLPKVAELPPADGPPQPRFFVVRGSRIWLGGAGVALYELTADNGSPRLVWQRFAGDSILQSPTLSGDLVIVARTRHDLPGAWVAALDSQTGEPKWETALGAPLASPPAAESAGKSLRAIHPLLGEIDRAAVPAEAQVLETAPMILPDSALPSFPATSGSHENRQPARSWSLGIRAVWGPTTVGDVVLAATDRELHCFDAKGGLLWKQSLPDGPPVGAPLQRGGEFVFASATGTIWRVDRKTGDQTGMLDVGQPLASGPTMFNKRIVVAAADGSLLFIELP
jgi:outer membrane protein assembly factor BamB